MSGACLRVLTWNVHSCIGTDGRLDPQRVRECIAAIDPDIAALQEVDSRRDRRDGFDLLGDCLGGHRAEVRTIRTPDGDYGHMLLSRTQMTAWVHHDVSFRRREPRSLIEALVEFDGCTIGVLSAHFGLSRRERRTQADRLAALAAADNVPTVIAGDFNEPTGFGAATRRLRRNFHSAGRRATYPSRWPLFPLDRIWFEPSLELVSSGVWTDARGASDHLPLWADFRLKR
jgi:endonuclease/exonuclease/phosphatase family metal-dependent hydrolase